MLLVIVPGLAAPDPQAASEAAKESSATAEAPVLALIDGPTGCTLFTLDDIVRFDWDNQVFQLTSERTMDLLALRVLTREFRLVAGKEIIYRGAFYSPISSNLPGGPIITLGPMADAEVKPPLFHIELSRFTRNADPRFSPTLHDILAKAGKLGAIDPKKIPPLTSVNTDWGREQGLNVRAVIFPETFTLKSPARLQLWFARDRDQPLPDTAEVLVTIEDKDHHRSVNSVDDLPIVQIVEAGDAYILKLNGWATENGVPFTPGPGRLLLEINTYRALDIGPAQASVLHRILFPWIDLAIQ